MIRSKTGPAGKGEEHSSKTDDGTVFLYHLNSTVEKKETCSLILRERMPVLEMAFFKPWEKDLRGGWQKFWPALPIPL